MPQGTPERPDVGPAATEPFAIDNAARLSTAVGWSSLVPTLGVMLSPPLGLAATPVLRAAAYNPLAATEVVAGLGLWAALFIVSARPLLPRFGSQRCVRIAGGMLSVDDRAILGARACQRPRNAFRGIANRVGSSLSGVRRELRRAEIDPVKSLLLGGADTISGATIAAAGTLLGRPLLPGVRRHGPGVRAGGRPLLSLWRSLWRSLWPHPLRIGPVAPARRRRHQPQRSVG